jgi:uncharacterized membrane protein YsdA (DUF1294 family)
MISRTRAGSERRHPGRRQALGLSVLLLVALLVGGPGPAFAQGMNASGHADEGGPHPAERFPALPFVLLLAATGVGLAVILRRGREARALALALLVGWVGLESAIHSVHHFWDPQSAASCPLFLASQHADGAGTSPGITGTPTWAVQFQPTCDDPQVVPRQEFRSHEGRAPPTSPSV